MNDFTILQRPMDFCNVKPFIGEGLTHTPPSFIAFPAQGVHGILLFQKLKIHLHLQCGICIQVFSGNRKDY